MTFEEIDGGKTSLFNLQNDAHIVLPVSVVILTFNAAETIGATLASVVAFSVDVRVVDCGFTDPTFDIARRAGAKIVTHSVESNGVQRNWTIDTLALKCEWQAHLAADEPASDALASESRQLFSYVGPSPSIAANCIPRLVHFHHQPIRHGGMSRIFPLRLFRRRYGRCESRKYGQHFCVNGQSEQLKPNTPRSVCSDRNPSNAYASQNRRCRFAELAIQT